MTITGNVRAEGPQGSGSGPLWVSSCVLFPVPSADRISASSKVFWLSQTQLNPKVIFTIKNPKTKSWFERLLLLGTLTRQLGLSDGLGGCPLLSHRKLKLETNSSFY